MTEQEAETLTNRLSQIWEMPFQSYYRGENIEVRFQARNGLLLFVSPGDNELHYGGVEGCETPDETRALLDHVPSHRCKFWLSGFTGRASADERLEWSGKGRELGLEESYLQKLIGPEKVEVRDMVPLSSDQGGVGTRKTKSKSVPKLKVQMSHKAQNTENVKEVIVAPGKAIREEAEARANAADKEAILQRLNDAAEALSDVCNLIRQTTPQVREEVSQEAGRLIGKAANDAISIGQSL